MLQGTDYKTTKESHECISGLGDKSTLKTLRLSTPYPDPPHKGEGDVLYIEIIETRQNERDYIAI